jgi:hypothetical protein
MGRFPGSSIGWVFHQAEPMRGPGPRPLPLQAAQRRKCRSMAHQDAKGRWYRSRRVGRRVCRDYLGTGADAALIAALDNVDRERREMERWKHRIARESLDEEEIEAARVSRIVQERLSAVLEASGYRRHNRGEWRRTRAR